VSYLGRERPSTPCHRTANKGRFANGLSLFDLLNPTWMTRYDPADDEEYRLNLQITDVIGGK